MTQPIPVIVYEKLSWDSHKYFNINSFPGELSDLAMNCCDLIALFEKSRINLNRNIKTDKSEFMNILKGNDFKGFSPTQDKPAMIYYHNLSSLTSFISFVIFMKMFFDQFSCLISKSIYPKSSIRGFNKGKVKDKIISGGKLILWLRNSAPESFENKNRLADIFEDNSNDWMDELTKLRDFFIHNPNLIFRFGLQVYLEKSVSFIKIDEIGYPYISDPNIDCVTFVAEKRHACIELIKMVIPLLPTFH